MRFTIEGKCGILIMRLGCWAPLPERGEGMSRKRKGKRLPVVRDPIQQSQPCQPQKKRIILGIQNTEAQATKAQTTEIPSTETQKIEVPTTETRGIEIQERNTQGLGAPEFSTEEFAAQAFSIGESGTQAFLTEESGTQVATKRELDTQEYSKQEAETQNPDREQMRQRSLTLFGAAGRKRKPKRTGKRPTGRKTSRVFFSGLSLKSPRHLAVAAVVVLALLASTIWYFNPAKPAVAITVDGQQVAIARSQEQVDLALEKVVEDFRSRTGLEPRITSVVGYQKVRARGTEVSDEHELVKRLSDRVDIVVTATEIRINGQPELIVKDQETAETLIARIKDQYKPQDGEVESVSLVETVEFVSRDAKPEELLDIDSALDLIRNGSDKVQKYTVKKGDSLWSIARANNMRVADLLAANPGLTEKLSISQQINLVKVEPLLHVLTTAKIKAVEEIPAPVQVTTDSSLPRGQERVKAAGTKGSKEVVYRTVTNNGTVVSRETLSENVIKQPTPRVVVRGKAAIVASRGDGSGRLSWPLRGQITSSYGRRGNEFHSGIDIDGTTGQAVAAAAAGKVIFAGTVGGYGKMVTIDHGNGLVTRYAHNSSILVSVGQSVSQGQTIAKVGSTGRSTGSHLHFEVLVNGTFQNPMNFLR